jgi:hypothetical protein
VEILTSFKQPDPCLYICRVLCHCRRSLTNDLMTTEWSTAALGSNSFLEQTHRFTLPPLNWFANPSRPCGDASFPLFVPTSQQDTMFQFLVDSSMLGPCDIRGSTLNYNDIKGTIPHCFRDIGSASIIFAVLPVNSQSFHPDFAYQETLTMQLYFLM